MAADSPFPVDMPMLHGMADIAGLDDVLNDDSGLAVYFVLFAFDEVGTVTFLECFVPPAVAKCL